MPKPIRITAVGRKITCMGKDNKTYCFNFLSAHTEVVHTKGMYVEVYTYTRPASGTPLVRCRTTIRMTIGGGTTPENHSVNQTISFVISSAVEKIEFLCRFSAPPNDPYIAQWHISGYEEDFDARSLVVSILP